MPRSPGSGCTSASLAPFPAPRHGPHSSWGFLTINLYQPGHSAGPVATRQGSARSPPPSTSEDSRIHPYVPDTSASHSGGILLTAARPLPRQGPQRAWVQNVLGFELLSNPNLIPSTHVPSAPTACQGLGGSRRGPCCAEGEGTARASAGGARRPSPGGQSISGPRQLQAKVASGLGHGMRRRKGGDTGSGEQGVEGARATPRAKATGRPWRERPEGLSPRMNSLREDKRFSFFSSFLFFSPQGPG